MFDPDKVIKQYKNAIHKVAHLYYFDNPRFSYKDLVAEAEVAAIQACKRYIDNGKATFFTYLTSSMNRHVQKYVKNNRYDIKVTEWGQRKEFGEHGNLDKITQVADAVRMDSPPKDDPVTRSGGHGSFTLPSGELPPDIAMIRSESIGILMEELESLPDREKSVLSKRWLDGETLEKIATGFGVTKQTIHGWSKKGFERLQKRVKARIGNELVF
jgi:RNA polymerase sigma factor (sigma-70 family)